MKVKYTGTSDFQVFNKSDFQRAGVEDQGKVTFAKDEPTEVTDSAGTALLSTDSEESIFHDFSFEEVTDEEDEEPLKIDDEEADSKSVRTKAEGSDTSGSTSSETSGSTGRGSSTGGSGTSGRSGRARSTGGSTT